MNVKQNKLWFLGTFLAMAMLVAVPWVATRAAQLRPQAASRATEQHSEAATVSEALRGKVLNYIREKFAVPDTVKLTMGAPHQSTAAAGFIEVPVTADDGKTPRTQNVLVSKDGRFLIVILANVMDLPQSTPAAMAQQVRTLFKVPADTKLSVGGFKASLSPDFQEGTLSIDNGKGPKQDRTVLLSRDGKHLIVSEIFNLSVDLREQALHTISLHDVASQGPADAPVTIVEYADLECPTCARMQDFLETQLIPRYGNKVRVVFKEFPLPMHDWSTLAAVADECAFEMNPSTFVPLRTAVFRSQQSINITNVRDTVLNFGEQLGLDRAKLAGCVDAKSSYPRIQRDLAEAKRLGVNQTPTLYVNGKMMIGLPSEDEYFQVIDADLRTNK